jgi:hypothetical protein
MLGVRSKIAVTIAVVAGLTALAAYISEHVSWAKEPLEDWYIS